MSNEILKINQKIMDEVATTLSKPYPKGREMFSPVEVNLWFLTVEQIESRLLLANAMLGGSWMKGPKVISFDRVYKSNSGDTGEARVVMKKSDVEQARLLVEQLILNISSSQQGLNVQLPFKQIMELLVRFKAHITQDPLLRTLFHKVADCFRDKSPSTLPVITGISKKENLRLWYKYHGYYRVLIKVVELPHDYLAESLNFDRTWLNESEDLIVMLFAYAIHSGRSKESIPKILPYSEGLLVDYPSLKTIHNSMKAYIL